MMSNGMMMKLYRKKLLQPMRPYVPGEDLSSVSVSDEDTPEIGGMIAQNPKNPADQWYVAKTFFEQNYEAADLLDRQRWVPVSERLPEHQQLVLTYMPHTDYSITIAMCYDEHWYDPADPDYYFKPSHWMPLPEPPKDE